MWRKAEKGRGGGKWRWIYIFVDLTLGPALIKAPALLCSLVFPMNTQVQKRQPQTLDHNVAPNSLPGPVTGSVSHCGTRVPPKSLQNQNTQSQFQRTSEQDPVNFINGISKGRSQLAQDSSEVNFISCGQLLNSKLYTVVGAEVSLRVELTHKLANNN